jgi:GntR family transcriptional regulator
MIPFSVTFKSGIPIYEQVIYAVKKAIVSGRLQEDDPFPSIRELSKELRINPNTAQKIVTLLVQEKLIEIKPGIGSIVSKLGNATEGTRQHRGGFPLRQGQVGGSSTLADKSFGLCSKRVFVPARKVFSLQAIACPKPQKPLLQTSLCVGPERFFFADKCPPKTARGITSIQG